MENERLTKRGITEEALCNRQDCDNDCYKCDLPDKQQEKLAAYEDTEHSPDDLKIMIRSYSSMKEELSSYRASGLSPEQAQEIAKAQAEGRSIMLPSLEESDYTGLKVKYRVYKAKDNAPVEGCFVLRPDKDLAAVAALTAYAKATANKQLAIDILQWVSNICLTQGGGLDEP